MSLHYLHPGSELPRAAAGRYPFTDHRTCAEIEPGPSAQPAAIEPSAFVRGVAFGLALSTPLWALALYLLELAR